MKGVVLISLLFLMDCAFSIPELQPRPNVPVVTQGKPALSLRIAGEVRDTFEVQGKNGIMGSQVLNWHTSLKNGFRAGFRDIFQVDQPGGYTIELTRVEPEVVTAADSAQVGVVAVRVQITYRAALIDANGQVVKVAAETVSSKSAITMRPDVPAGYASAIESMFEDMGQKLFSTSHAQR